MNIDKIEIYNNGQEVTILPKDNKYIIDNTSYDIETEEIERFLRMILSWNNNYYNDKDTDGIIFSIRIYSNGEIDEIKGIRDVPYNYSEFNEFVRMLYDRRFN